MAFEKLITLPNGEPYRVTKLLATESSNTKLKKRAGRGENFLIASLSLAPHMASGYNLCASASPGCIKSCIYTSGYARIHPRKIQPARIAKSVYFMQDRPSFQARLAHEISNILKRLPKGQRLAIRLNVFSDVLWEKVMPGLFEQFSDVRFYDYTKHYKRMVRSLTDLSFPNNYHLTFSASETNTEESQEILRLNGQVAVPFRVKKITEFPRFYWGYPVHDGDSDDLRFLDPTGIIALKVKGDGKKDTTGFIKEVEG